MKRIVTVLLVIFSVTVSCSVKAQWVTIPDPNFAAWLQLHYPSCMNGNQMDTTCSGIVNAISVTGLSYNVADLTGIQYFDNLHFLNCSNLNISSLPPLPVFLDTLNCALNNIISLPNLSPTLTHLTCSSNQLTNLPNLPNTLKYLFCDGNQLVSLPPLPDSLQYLYCGGNLLSLLPALPNALIHLQCESNQISSLPTLPTSLNFLECSHNQITALPFLPSTITWLGCHHNQLTSLPTLPNSLDYLGCGYNLISSLPSLPNTITQIVCAYNQLTSLPNLPVSLTVLGCAFNQLLSMPSLPGTLINLDCRNNQLTGLPELPDSMYDFRIANNPNILCLPPLHKFVGSSSFFWIANTGITCLPNFIQHPWAVAGIDTMPICDVFNTNGCSVGWNIQGKTVFDSDSNCGTLNDGVDVPMLKMNLYDSGNNLIQQVIANSGGDYSFDTQLGNYSTSVDTVNIPFNVLCPSNNNINSNLTIADSMDYNVDFRLKCKSGFDVGAWNVHLWNSFFPGESTFVNTIAGDYGQFLSNGICTSGSLSGEIKIVINGPATYDSSFTGGLTPVAIGDTLVFSVSDFSLLNISSDISFYVTTDTTAQLGDIICFDIGVTPTNGDNNISNNELTQCFVVGNSYDPNYKEVSPINIFNQDDWLTYTIHFQNTGTAPAHHIQVLDTLNANLDASTFQLLSYSHTPMVQLFGSKVHFNFVNINLPDSTSDFEGSKGYVSYRVKPLANLPLGTTIENTASIYFDYNAPVITNTVSNLICIPIVPTTISQTICAGDIFSFNGVNLTVAGVYSDTLNAINSCDSVVTLTLTVETINTTVTQTSDTLTATTTGTIQWLDCNTQQIIAGANTSVFVPTITGSYAAIITEGNCSDTSACMQVFTGVDQLSVNSSQFTVYPNPTDENITVTLSQPCENCKMEISNPLGQIVYSAQTNSQLSIINCQLLPAGVYFIALRSDRMSAVKKLVKQ